MKKLLIAALVSAGMILASAATHATVINFDELNANGKGVAMTSFNKYAGFTWSTNWQLADTTVAGYDNGARSGINFVRNGFGANNLSISSATSFDFGGAGFAIANNNGGKASWVNITALDAAGKQIGSTGNVTITSSYSFIVANFADVSKLTITRDNGWFVMDDFTLGHVEVPEPGTLLMFGMGIAALAASRRKQA